jgi:predicted NACHT family NTPase
VTPKDWEDVKTGKTDLRVYFDGLDEIADEVKREKVVGLAREWLEHYPRAKCVFTARDFVEGPWTAWLERICLSGLDAAGQVELRRRWLGSGTELERTFARELECMPAMSRVMHVPLLATLTLLVFRGTGRLPASRTQLYETFLDLLCGGWDLAKGVMRDRVFGRAPTEMVITRLAASIHWKKRRNFDVAAVSSAIAETLRRGFAPKGEVLISELLEDGIFVRLPKGLQFAHLSFQEFLAAKNMVGDLHREKLRLVLAAYLRGDNWWRETIEFYIGLSGSPHDLAAMALAIQKEGSSWRSREFLLMVEEQYPDAGISEKFAGYLNEAGSSTTVVGPSGA